MMSSIPIPARPVIVPLKAVPTASSAGRGVFIETGGYVLRSLTPADVTEDFAAWLNADSMLRGLNLGRLKFTPAALQRFIAGFDNHHNYFIGIFHRETGLLVGFYTIDVNLMHKVGSITTGIGVPEYLGKGTLWATIDALLDTFYAERDIEKFTARILARNHAMLFNFKDNTRFVLEANLKQECRAPDGQRLDLLVFASYKNGPLPQPKARGNGEVTGN